MAQVSLSLAQMDIKKGNPRQNWGKIQQMSQAAKQQGGQIVIFPELCDAGYALKQAKDIASALNGGLFAQLAALSKQLGIYITGSMLEKRGLGVANCAPMISPDRGVLGAYRKVHLFPPMQEDLYLSAGEGLLTIDNLPWGATSLAICYDLRFPEMFRRYAMDGAKLVILPAEWPAVRAEHYRALIRARAIENGYYVAAVNRVGTDIDEETGAETGFIGYSSIIDPFGQTVLEVGNHEGVFTATIDLDLVAKAQAAIPVLDNRRADLYGY
jgi:omega-amidase